MPDTPLVTVVTPTYQSARTLPRALRSLQNQSHQRWEWLVINDGSTDQTSTFLSGMTDSRVRVIALEENQGRGYVRNLALSQANGSYICSLDADDWFYRRKLESQVRALEADRKLTAATVGMAVTDENGRIVGVEGRTPERVEREVPGPCSLRFPFGPTMIRADVARETGFQQGMRRGADVDFFVRLLCGNGRRIAHLPGLSYVYQGHRQSIISELLSGHSWSRRVYARHLRRFPRDCAVLIASSFLKSTVYRASQCFGGEEWLSRRRFKPLTAAELEEYEEEVRRLGE